MIAELLKWGIGKIPVRPEQFADIIVKTDKRNMSDVVRQALLKSTIAALASRGVRSGKFGFPPQSR
jgi:hypothetical protein